MNARLMNELSLARDRLSRYTLGNFRPSKDEEMSGDRLTVYCRRCHKPKRMLKYSTILGKEWYAPTDSGCDCDRKRNEEEENRKRIAFCRKYYNTEKYVEEIKQECIDARLGTIDPNYFNPDFYDVRDAMLDYIDSYKPGDKGISVTGSVGLGKSTLMSCLRNECLYRGFSCVLATISKIAENTRNRISTEWFSYETYWNVDMLIIDDIGADFHPDSRFDKAGYNSIFFSLINERWNRNMTTCFTSNLYARQLEELGIDNRALDRLYEMVDRNFTLQGESLRKTKGGNNGLQKLL